MQFPSKTGKKVTEAVICRKMAWISSCISASVFSGGGDAAASPSLEAVSNVSRTRQEDVYVGVTFSLSTAFPVALLLFDLLNI